MATLASLRVVARVPTGAAPSGAGSIRAGATKQLHRITRGKSVVASAAGAGTTPRTAGVRGARSTTRSRTRATRDDEVQAEGGAFDDALADVFKQLYPSGGVKRIKWGVFKESVAVVTTTEEEQAALREEASVSLTNIDADERARRGLAGTAFGIACAILAAVQLATGAPPAQRAIMAVPLFLGLGFKGSEATGL